MPHFFISETAMTKCPVCGKEFDDRKRALVRRKTCSKRCGDERKKKLHGRICRRGG